MAVPSDRILVRNAELKAARVFPLSNVAAAFKAVDYLPKVDSPNVVILADGTGPERPGSISSKAEYVPDRNISSTIWKLLEESHPLSVKTRDSPFPPLAPRHIGRYAKRLALADAAKQASIESELAEIAALYRSPEQAHAESYLKTVFSIIEDQAAICRKAIHDVEELYRSELHSINLGLARNRTATKKARHETEQRVDKINDHLPVSKLANLLKWGGFMGVPTAGILSQAKKALYDFFNTSPLSSILELVGGTVVALSSAAWLINRDVEKRAGRRKAEEYERLSINEAKLADEREPLLEAKRQLLERRRNLPAERLREIKECAFNATLAAFQTAMDYFPVYVNNELRTMQNGHGSGVDFDLSKESNKMKATELIKQNLHLRGPAVQIEAPAPIDVALAAGPALSNPAPGIGRISERPAEAGGLASPLPGPGSASATPPAA